MHRWLPLERGLDAIFMFSFSRCIVTAKGLGDSAQLIQFYLHGVLAHIPSQLQRLLEKKLASVPQRLNAINFLNTERPQGWERKAPQGQTLGIAFQK